MSQRLSQSKVYAEDTLTGDTSWHTIKSAADLASIFGINETDIGSRLIASVCNGDFDASPGSSYSWSLSNQNGFEVRCSNSNTTRCRYRIACV